jgi:seryl-tRNA synthetase
MANIQTTTIRVPKEVAESIKIYCKKHGRNVGDFVESAWNFIEKNDFDIYDDEATPCLPVQEQQGSEIAALCKLMAEFISTTQQKQLPQDDNKREKETQIFEDLIKRYQAKIDEKEEEVLLLRETVNNRTNKLERAKNELKRLKKGIFNRPDEDVLKELGII